MAADDPLEYTQFDTEPPLECDLEEHGPDDTVFVPMDLTGKTVRLLAQNRRTKTQFGGIAIKVDVPPVSGVLTPARVRYLLQETDLAVPGDWQYQWEITALNGARRTVPPGDSFFEFKVSAKLGAAV